MNTLNSNSLCFPLSNMFTTVTNTYRLQAHTALIIGSAKFQTLFLLYPRYGKRSLLPVMKSIPPIDCAYIYIFYALFSLLCHPPFPSVWVS